MDNNAVLATPVNIINVADLPGGSGSSGDPSTGTPTNVTAATSATVLLAANTSRRGAAIWNDSTSVMYLLLGTGTVAANLCSLKVPADGYFEVPFRYKGAISAIWVAVNGAARITEFT